MYTVVVGALKARRPIQSLKKHGHVRLELGWRLKVQKHHILQDFASASGRMSGVVARIAHLLLPSACPI